MVHDEENLKRRKINLKQYNHKIDLKSMERKTLTRNQIIANIIIVLECLLVAGIIWFVWR